MRKELKDYKKLLLSLLSEIEELTVYATKIIEKCEPDAIEGIGRTDRKG